MASADRLAALAAELRSALGCHGQVRADLEAYASYVEHLAEEARKT